MWYELILATEKVYVFSIMHKGRTTKDLRKNFQADLNFILCHPTMSEHKSYPTDFFTNNLPIVEINTCKDYKYFINNKTEKGSQYQKYRYL